MAEQFPKEKNESGSEQKNEQDGQITELLKKNGFDQVDKKRKTEKPLPPKQPIWSFLSEKLQLPVGMVLLTIVCDSYFDFFIADNIVVLLLYGLSFCLVEEAIHQHIIKKYTVFVIKSIGTVFLIVPLIVATMGQVFLPQYGGFNSSAQLVFFSIIIAIYKIIILRNIAKKYMKSRNL